MTLTIAQREGVIALARRAALEILAVYDSEFAVEHKGDRSPLTAADLASHRCIVEGLRALTPDIPVLSEESRDADVAARREWRTLWLVDPLDGTREFVKRNGEFTVNIALIVDGVATFGVIQQPVTGRLWHGAPREGAWRRDGDEDVSIHVSAPAHAPLRVAASRSHRDARTQAVLDALQGEAVACGSSLKFCRIAEGDMDLYPRFGPTSEWDTAAGQAILEGAGGAVVDAQGRAFRYNQRETLLNGDFLAFGDGSLQAMVPA
jgi:3'(2'), 5'-bisphosphate nucleotidase